MQLLEAFYHIVDFKFGPWNILPNCILAGIFLHKKSMADGVQKKLPRLDTCFLDGLCCSC